MFARERRKGGVGCVRARAFLRTGGEGGSGYGMGVGAGLAGEGRGETHECRGERVEIDDTCNRFARRRSVSLSSYSDSSGKMIYRFCPLKKRAYPRAPKP
jgi:hypothetical protein